MQDVLGPSLGAPCWVCQSRNCSSSCGCSPYCCLRPTCLWMAGGAQRLCTTWYTQPNAALVHFTREDWGMQQRSTHTHTHTSPVLTGFWSHVCTDPPGFLWLFMWLFQPDLVCLRFGFSFSVWFELALLSWTIIWLIICAVLPRLKRDLLDRICIMCKFPYFFPRAYRINNIWVK